MDGRNCRPASAGNIAPIAVTTPMMASGLSRGLARRRIRPGSAARAKAQDDDMAARHAFAREAPRACHIVEAEESSPREFEIGTAFCDIANVPGMTAAALRVSLTSSHPKKPNLAPDTGGNADVTAYVPSLRDHG